MTDQDEENAQAVGLVFLLAVAGFIAWPFVWLKDLLKGERKP